MAVSRIKVVGSGAAGAANGGAVTINFGFTPKANDLIVVFGGNTGNGATAGVSTAGYTELTAISNTGANYVRFAHKVANGSENSCTGRGSGDGNHAMQYSWVVLRGVDTTTPLDGVAQGSAQADATANGDPASITPATAGAAVLQALSINLNTTTIDPPSGYTELTAGATNDTNPHATNLAIKLNCPASAENAGAWTHSAADYVVATIVLRPRTVKDVFVDDTNGLAGNDGLTSSTPKQTFAQATALLGMGDTLKLAVGETWNELLTVPTDDITVTTYGTGSNPVIDGDGVRVGLVNAYELCQVTNINFLTCTNGAYVTGSGATMTVTGGTYTDNGTGIVAGGGGRLITVSGVTCTGGDTGIGAGDGIQISEDASTGATTITSVTCTGNDKAGVNHKKGTLTLSNSTLSTNGEPGLLVQNPSGGAAPVCNASGLTIEGNNTANNGTFNIALENDCQLTITKSISKNPAAGAGGAYHISQTGASTLSINASIFVSDTSQTNVTAVIRSNTGASAATLTLYHNTCVVTSGTAIIVDAYGATGINIGGIKNNIFKTANSRCLRIPPAVLTAEGSSIDYNLYYNAASGNVIEAQDTESYTAAQLADAFTDYGIEDNGVAGDPDFVDAATYDFRLYTGSPALGAGVAGTGVTEDYDSDTYGSPPNIGAEADSGVSVPTSGASALLMMGVG